MDEGEEVRRQERECPQGARRRGMGRGEALRVGGRRRLD